MRRRKKNLTIILVLLFLGLGLGYAFLTQDLTISGIGKVKGNEWDIHFENVNVFEYENVELSEGDSAPVIDPTTRTRVNCIVTLNLPGDEYSFTVDAVNDGTVDAMLESATLKMNGSVITTLPNYLDYSVTYGDGTPIIKKHLLAAGDTETFLVTVTFKRDIDEEDLLDTMESNSLSFEANYIQADNHAINRFVTSYTALGATNQANINPSWEYYLRRRGASTITTEDLYELQYYENDQLIDTDGDYTLSQCQEREFEETYDTTTYKGICVKTKSVGDPIVVNIVNKAYIIADGQEIDLIHKWDCGYRQDICEEPNGYIMTKKAEAESKGYTCTYSSNRLDCENDNMYFKIILSRDDLEVTIGKTGEGYCSIHDYITPRCEEE